MKKILISIFITVLIVGTISAQTRTDRQREQVREHIRTRDTVTVDGELKLERGFVAVESGDSVFLVPMLTRYIGFINELKEGTRVSVEGFSFRNIIHPTKITIAEKSFEFATPRSHHAFSKGQNERRQLVPNRGNYDHRRDNLRPHHNRHNRKFILDCPCPCLNS